MCFKDIPNDDIICTLFEFSMVNVHKENCIYISRTIIDINIYNIQHTAAVVGLATLEQKNKYSPRIRNSERKPTNAIAYYFYPIYLFKSILIMCT